MKTPQAYLSLKNKEISKEIGFLRTAFTCKNNFTGIMSYEI
jgi:hypothetical protein